MPLSKEKRSAVIQSLNALHLGAYKDVPHTMDEDIVVFTQENYAKVTKGGHFPHEIEDATVFAKYSYHLMIYCASLTEAFSESNRGKYKSNYLDYINEDNMFSRALAAGNPLVILKHCCQLNKIVECLKNEPISDEGKKQLYVAIYTLENAINTLSPVDDAGIKATFFAYRDMLLGKFIQNCLPEERRDPSLMADLEKKVNEALRIADLTAEEGDCSISLYRDKNLVGAFPVESSGHIVEQSFRP
jgi:hypothetical protein